MRKSTISASGSSGAYTDVEWLDIEKLARVEVTSEDRGFPIESVFSPGGSGWRAARPGDQLIRLIFDEPQTLHRVKLRFSEPEIARTQEFTLRWSQDGRTFREIVRQQWNFSPQGSTIEVEEYEVDLAGVSAMELAIRPEITAGNAVASLERWRIG